MYNSRRSEASTIPDARVVEVSTNRERTRKAGPLKKPAPNNQSASPPSAKEPLCTIPLICVLLAQCFLVAAVFVVLIVVVTLRMTSTTEQLVEERIAADLRYSKGSIIEPIDNAQKALMAHRLRYISLERELGRPLCSADNNSFIESRHFFRDALATVYTHFPTIGWVYVTQTTNKWRHPVTGDLGVSECSTSVNYMFTNDYMVVRTSQGPVTVDETDTFEGVTWTEDNTTDFRYEGYVVEGLEHTDFGWWPYLWIEPTTGKAFLLMGGFAPLLLNRTLSNGTIVTYQPDLTIPKAIKRDPSQQVVSTIAMDLLLSHVNDLIAQITPPTAGAHSSLYDLNHQTLLATSEDIRLTDNNDDMWSAGRSSSSTLNEAFHIMNPKKGVDERDDSVRVVYSGNRIISSINIATDSDINFVIIQSTPIEYYFGTIYALRGLMIGLGVTSACVVVAVCVVVVVLIRRSISEIESGMLLAAVLKNDQVKHSRSLIKELDELCVAFSRMNAKLGAARAFMPQSMLVSSSDGEQTMDEDEASTIYTQTNHIDPSQPDDVSNPTDDNTLTGIQYQLQSKRVTILYINTKGFHKKGADVLTVGSHVNELTSTIHAICALQRGVIDSFHGDRFVLSFNAARYNAQGPQLAIRSALDIIVALGGKVQAFSMGAATGKALVGQLGSTELKRFSIIGKVYSQAVTLERICKQVQTEGTREGYSAPSLVIDETLSHEVEHLAFLQVLGRFESIDESSGKPTHQLLYGVLGSSENVGPSTDEWLYEVKDDDVTNARFDPTLSLVNRAVLHLLSPAVSVQDDLVSNFSQSIDQIARQKRDARSQLPGVEHGDTALMRAKSLLCIPSLTIRDLTFSQ